MSSNRETIKETLAALGPMSYRALEEASGVPGGSFGRSLRESVAAGEIERDDTRYQIPSADARILHFCALCGGSHVKGPSGWACKAQAS